jgi:hypothetical protein
MVEAAWAVDRTDKGTPVADTGTGSRTADSQVEEAREPLRGQVLVLRVQVLRVLVLVQWSPREERPVEACWPAAALGRARWRNRG